MTDVPSLADVLLTNFVTVRFPRMEVCQAEPQGLPFTRTIQRLTRALRTDWLIISCHRLRIRCDLAEHRHVRFLDRIQADDSRSWRVHFFCLDKAAARLIGKITGESCGPGAPLRFDPREFVCRRLRNLERQGRLEQDYPWWDTDFG